MGKKFSISDHDIYAMWLWLDLLQEIMHESSFTQDTLKEEKSLFLQYQSTLRREEEQWRLKSWRL
jgi:predicted Zn-dependent peptidase